VGFKPGAISCAPAFFVRINILKMKEYLNKKVIITTQSWFYAPDGVLYRAVWGTLKGVHAAKDVLGFTVNHSHANFYVEIGDTVIAGCQALYCVACPTRPEFKEVQHAVYDNPNGLKVFNRPNEIYLAE
jgi:hypothetical protein